MIHSFRRNNSGQLERRPAGCKSTGELCRKPRCFACKSVCLQNGAVLCYIEGNDVARDMYEKLGFFDTGEADEDEIIMEKKLR